MWPLEMLVHLNNKAVKEYKAKQEKVPEVRKILSTPSPYDASVPRFRRTGGL